MLRPPRVQILLRHVPMAWIQHVQSEHYASHESVFEYVVCMGHALEVVSFCPLVEHLHAEQIICLCGLSGLKRQCSAKAAC